MLKYLIFLQIFIGSIFAQEESLYFKADYPDFIPINTSFELSIITSNPSLKADSLEFVLYAQSNISLTGGVLVEDSSKKKLTLHNIGSTDHSGNTFKTGFPLVDSSETKYYQVKFAAQPKRFTNKSKINFELRYFNDSLKTAEYSSYAMESYLRLPSADIKFYEPQAVAGKCLAFSGDQSLDVNISSVNQENLLVEFWMKLNSGNTGFFNILDENSDTLLTASSNPFQIIELDNCDISLILDSYFVSRNSWYHFVLYLPDNGLDNYLYINDKLIFKLPKLLPFASDDIKLEFNSTKKNAFYLDVLRIWNYGEDIEQLFKNKHYRNISTDSSEILFSQSFDETNISRMQKSGKISVQYGNLTLTPSKAPIFSKIPELNIIPYQNFYSISWSPRSTEYVDQFILERSSGGNKFDEIYSIEVQDKGEDNKFEYTDARRLDEDIVFYRLKQINQDSTIIYSSNTKIGQAEVEQFDVDENYPNPFNPETKITVEMYRKAEVQITVYNLVGKKVSTLHNGVLSKGQHDFTFNGKDLPSGIYLCEVKSKNSTVVQKMILAK